VSWHHCSNDHGSTNNAIMRRLSAQNSTYSWISPTPDCQAGYGVAGHGVAGLVPCTVPYSQVPGHFIEQVSCGPGLKARSTRGSMPCVVHRTHLSQWQ
jgi:hypothetical protein